MLVASLVLPALLSACSDEAVPPTAADCAGRVRADGTVYTSYGHTERRASRHAAAEVAACHDVGEDPAGSVFAEHPKRVTTWSFRGYSPGEVLGVRLDAGSFEVYVADSVPSVERERILRELSGPSR